jgi:hypothetical protein
MSAEQRILLTRDIAAILTSVDCAIRATMAATETNPAYLRGARDALAAVAVAIGIAPGLVLPEIEEAKRGR